MSENDEVSATGELTSSQIACWVAAKVVASSFSLL